MRAFRNTQLRRDLLQNCLSITQNGNGNSTTTTATTTTTMECQQQLASFNPDVVDDRLFNSAFRTTHPQKMPNLVLSRPGTFYSQAQLDRMKAYMDKLPVRELR